MTMDSVEQEVIRRFEQEVRNRKLETDSPWKFSKFFRRWMDKWLDGWIGGWMDGSIDEWLDKWMGSILKFCPGTFSYNLSLTSLREAFVYAKLGTFTNTTAIYINTK